jgi:hypothetical protein
MFNPDAQIGWLMSSRMSPARYATVWYNTTSGHIIFIYKFPFSKTKVSKKI